MNNIMNYCLIAITIAAALIIFASGVHVGKAIILHKYAEPIYKYTQTQGE